MNYRRLYRAISKAKKARNYFLAHRRAKDPYLIYHTRRERAKRIAASMGVRAWVD